MIIIFSVIHFFNVQFLNPESRKFLVEQKIFKLELKSDTQNAVFHAILI